MQLRFKTVSTRDITAGYVAMQEFRFFDSAGQQITPVSATNPDGDNVGPAHTVDLLIDGIVATDGTSKWLDANKGHVIFDFGSQGETLASYEWVTCEDHSERDPVSWDIEARQGVNDAWIVLHSISSYGTTTVTDRNTVVGPFQIDPYVSGLVVQDAGCELCPASTSSLEGSDESSDCQ